MTLFEIRLAKRFGAIVFGPMGMIIGSGIRRLQNTRCFVVVFSPEHRLKKEFCMSDGVYKVIELVGTSTESWEEAARNAVDRASDSLNDLRVAAVVDQDLKIEDNKVTAYRTKLRVSFKFRD
ncbi:MAG: dodecin family protein [Arenicellales bacterium]|nr:dodecin family protein [Arenicellales bacterium]